MSTMRHGLIICFIKTALSNCFTNRIINTRVFQITGGASKGIDSYGSVCVVLNKRTDELYKKGRLTSLAPTTRNKLYVACTRSRQDLFFVPEKYYQKYKT